MNFGKIILSFLLLSINQTGVAQELDEYQWNNRLVLLLTKNEICTPCERQLNALKHNAEGVPERKILTFVVTPQKFKNTLDETWKENKELYTRFRKTESDFEFILIGLDGGVKLRKSHFVPISDVFALIDTMPMRQNEMRKQDKH